jgi:sugar lactone lactonase YvrE
MKSLNIKVLYYVLAISLIIIISPSIVFSGDYKMWVYATLPEVPEGLCIDSKKNPYATMAHIGEVVLIKDDGTAGKAVIHSTGHCLFDGIEIDDEGYIYASEPSINQIVVISPQAGWAGITPRKVIATGATLQG